MRNKKNSWFNMPRFSIFIVLALFATMNSGCPHGHMQTYVSIVPGSISGTVRTFDGSSISNAMVFLAGDSLLSDKKVLKQVKTGGGFSFDNLDPGRYYIAAYIDTKNDGTYTIGEDYLGGKLVDKWDLDNTYYPEVLEGRDTVIDIPLLAPMKMSAIENGTNAVSLNPDFKWDACSGAAFYRLRVTSRTQSYWVIDTPLTSKTYGISSQTGETLITPATQLAEDSEYFWTVIAYKESFVPIAYGDISRFFTIATRKFIEYKNFTDLNYK
ncbi:MAG TPA: carboxypeptidase-like regulatory domain-containing protein [Candidatus Wallbacteria bacterium]|nr:carboxypeptidase-like regulatory domain-containing protein [Candidatus Wallbacteria bacterium]